MTDDTRKPDIRSQVMEAIRARRVEAKPRWHFLLASVAGALAFAILAISLLYVTSLLLFILREHGLLVVPAFGWRGLASLTASLPWLVLGLSLVLAALFGSAVRRFAAFYRRPALVSSAAVLFVAVLTGLFVAKTPLHRLLAAEARDGRLPSLLGVWYREPFRTQRGPDAYAGTIVATVPDGFLAADDGDSPLVHVIITRRTMLPDGADFRIGARIMAIGDMVATATLEAYGVRAMDEDW